MTSIGSIYGSGSAWQDMQDWSAKQKAATDQFQSDTSQYTDSLFSGQVTQTQNLTTLIQQGAVARFQKLLAASAQTGGNQVNGTGDVFWGDGGSSSDSPPQATAPTGGTSSDVYWGVDPTSPVVTAAPSRPAMGSSSAVYWGTPSNVDITV